MGQKVNPIGYRTGIMLPWKSRWYASKKDFSELLIEDHKIRKFIKNHPKKPQYKQAGIDKIEVERTRDEVKITLYVARPGLIIGKKGQVLAAVQFIVNRAMNRLGLERRYVSVDADGYRSRREDSLANMARRLGRQAVSDGQIITFEPMSPRDRRVVHLALAKFDGVVTKSEGEGDDRRVQIIPVRRG